jgi:hypothetical protein
MSMGKDPIAAELGRRGGRKGGRARALSLTPEQRREIAQRAAAARWQRTDDIEEVAPGSLANTPMVTARGAAELDGQKLDAFVLEDGRKLIGLLSAALALDYGGDQLAQRVADTIGDEVVTFHVPGDWRLMRGIAPATLVGVCRTLADAASSGRSDRGARSRAMRAVAILAALAEDGLSGLVDTAVRPVGEPARMADGV